MQVRALVDAVHADLDEVRVRLGGLREREELDVRVADLGERAVDEVAEVDEHVRVAQEGHAEDDVEALDVGRDGLEGTNASGVPGAVWGALQGARDGVERVDGEGNVLEEESDVQLRGAWQRPHGRRTSSNVRKDRAGHSTVDLVSDVPGRKMSKSQFEYKGKTKLTWKLEET